MTTALDFPDLSPYPKMRHTCGKRDSLKYARFRNRAVWAQALVLFNVVGLTLSQGVYVEHYYTIVLPSRKLSSLSVIPASQILCLSITPLLAGLAYHWRGRRSGWKVLFFLAILVGFGAQLALQWVKSYTVMVILQGLVLGAALGTMFTLSTLVLGSHYEFNLPLISMQGGFMGFIGAVVYTTIARQGLSARIFVPIANGGIMLATLCTALLLIRRVEVNESSPGTKVSQKAMVFPQGLSKIFKEQGTCLFYLGDGLVFFGLLTFLTYIIAILSQPPALIGPERGALVLLTMYSFSAFSACIGANPRFRKRLGPVDTFIVASLFASVASIVPAWTPSLTAGLVCGGAYGISLGVVFALHIKVSTVFHHEKMVWHPDMPARVAIMIALCGSSAFAGLLGSAFIVETMREGVKIVTCMAAGCMLLGGSVIAIARWRRCGKFYVAI